MPCNSDYMKPDAREKQLQLTAKLLVYVYEKTGAKPEDWILREAENVYAQDERLVPALCGVYCAQWTMPSAMLSYTTRMKEMPVI